MSSMLKKKGGPSFKPKAPGRRAPGPSQSRTSSTRPSTEPGVEPPNSAINSNARANAAAFSANTRSHEASLAEQNNTPPVNPSNASTEAQNDSRSSETVDHILQQETEAGNSFSEQNGQPKTAAPTLVDETPQGNRSAQDEATTVDSENHMYLEDPSTSNDATTSLYPPPPADPGTPAPAGLDLSALGAGQSNQATFVVQYAPLNPDGTSGEPSAIPSTRQKKRSRKRLPAGDNESEVRPSIEGEGVKRRHRRTPQDADAVPKRSKRNFTPEDGEEQTIDHSTTKMAELCKDLKIGRKFSKHDEIIKRESEQRTKQKLARQNPELALAAARAAVSGMNEPRPVTPSAASRPQMRIVDGQIIIDESSLVVDRHQVAKVAEKRAEMEYLEEDEYSRKFTSGTFMKREANLLWTNLETMKFYDGLRMFGTDFEMISKMFPGRTRRQVVLKFKKEDREHQRKVTAALNKENVAIDFDEYQSHTGLEYEETEDIEQETRRLEEEHEVERRGREEAVVEAARAKKAEMLGASQALAPRRGSAGGDAASTAGTAAVAQDTNADAEDEAEAAEADIAPSASTTAVATASTTTSLATNATAAAPVAVQKGRKKAPPKRKKRNMHSTRGGGEEVEVLGDVDGVLA